MYDGYANAKCEVAAPSGLMNGSQYQPPTARKQLEQKKAGLLGELQRVEAALKALDKFPELEAFTETLKAGLR